MKSQRLGEVPRCSYLKKQNYSRIHYAKAHIQAKRSFIIRYELKKRRNDRNR